MSEKPFPFSGYEEIARKAWQMFRKTHGLNSYASILALNAWERVGKITRNDAILEESKQLAREYLSGRVPSVAGAYNSYIYQQGGNATAWLLVRGYLPEAEKILVPAAERLCREFPRDDEGLFIHPDRRDNLLWIDTVFAVCPFLVWVGKVLNPVFLAFLAILVIVALLSPSASAFSVEPDGDYVSQPLFTGLLEGYNTMDALASLAFGIVVIQVIRSLGIKRADDVSSCTVRAGIFSCLLMALIYLAVTVVGAQSRGAFETSANGGIALAQIAQYYLGGAGLFVLAATVTLACLKTAVGLTTSGAETFVQLFPKALGYRGWAVLFAAVSFLFANVGLSAIIEYAVPVLMLLCPLAVVLITLTLFGRLFGDDSRVFRWAIGFTIPAAVCGALAALPDGVIAALHLEGFNLAVNTYLPLARLGLGWVCPALVGLAVGLAVHYATKKPNNA